MQRLLSRITDLEAQVKQQSESMAAWHRSSSISHHHLSPYMGTFDHASPDPYSGLSISPHVLPETRPESRGVQFGKATTEDPNDAHQATASNIEARLGIDIDQEDSQDVSLTIPIEHWTTTDSLLLMPQIRSFIGDYPKNFFLQLESSRATAVQQAVRRHIADNSNLPQLLPQDVDTLIDAFFTHIHPAFPVLDRDMFMPIYYQTLERGLRSDPKSALCLVVFALGKVAMNTVEFPSLEEQDDLHGLEYFVPAYNIATNEWGLCYEVGHVLPLSLIHLALYLQYMNLPLQAWRMVHLTSTNLQYSIARCAMISLLSY